MNHATHERASTSRIAFQATIHCLTGCGIGEVLGLGGATLLGLGNAASIVLGIVLAYVFGYALTFVPLLRAGMPLLRATGITFAAETLSITTMEIVDNVVVLAIPGAMDAGLADLLFWASLALSLAVAFVAAFPVNRWLIGRGQGHAVVHGAH
jgi:putative flippase GtrA